VSDKTCRNCRYWHERYGDAGLCQLNPRVWAGSSWDYPIQQDTDTCSHFLPQLVMQPVVKGKAKPSAA
jgi:hypothetical protein